MGACCRMVAAVVGTLEMTEPGDEFVSKPCFLSKSSKVRYSRMIAISCDYQSFART